jgi:Polyketide cyclase / dehydrase and lipid transport
MRILKRVLFVLLGLVVVALIAAYFMPKSFQVTREVVINKPESEVFAYVKLLKNQDNWSVWNLMDSTMIKTQTGTDGTVGFIAGWDSKNENLGAGEQEIVEIEEGVRIDYALRFKRPFEDTSATWMSTDSIAPTQTKVVWGMKGEMAFPTNLMGLFMNMEEMIGKDYETSLATLKSVLE